MNKFLTSKQTSEILGIKEKTLAEWRYQGKNLSYTKIGKQIFYDPDDLKKFIDSKKIKIT